MHHRYILGNYFMLYVSSDTLGINDTKKKISYIE